MPSPKQKFERYYTEADYGFGDSDSDITLTNGKFVEIGALTTGAQQSAAWGIGKASDNGVDTRRNVTFRVDHTDGNQVHGVVRFAVSNATRTDIRIILEDRTENLDDGVPMAESGLRAKEDSHLLIFMQIDGSADKTLDVSDTNNTLLAPVTLYQ